MKERIKRYFSDFGEFIKFLLKFFLVWLSAVAGVFVGGILMIVLSPVLPVTSESVLYIVSIIFSLLTGHAAWKFLKKL